MSVPQSSPSYPQLSTKLTHLSLLIGILPSDINPEFTVTGCESHWALHINSNKCICWVLYRAICRPNSFQCHLQPCKSFNLSRDQIRQEPEEHRQQREHSLSSAPASCPSSTMQTKVRKTLVATWRNGGTTVHMLHLWVKCCWIIRPSWCPNQVLKKGSVLEDVCDHSTRLVLIVVCIQGFTGHVEMEVRSGLDCWSPWFWSHLSCSAAGIFCGGSIPPDLSIWLESGGNSELPNKVWRPLMTVTRDETFCELNPIDLVEMKHSCKQQTLSS